jgi:hypothetical protein
LGEAVTPPEAEFEVGRGGDLLPRPRLRPRPRSGVVMTPPEAEAGVGRGYNLLLLVLPWWLAQ